MATVIATQIARCTNYEVYTRTGTHLDLGVTAKVTIAFDAAIAIALIVIGILINQGVIGTLGSVTPFVGYTLVALGPTILLIGTFALIRAKEVPVYTGKQRLTSALTRENTELTERLEASEAEVTELNRQLQDASSLAERHENSNRESHSKNQQLTQARDRAIAECAQLQTRLSKSERSVQQLTQQLGEAQSRAARTDEKREEATRSQKKLKEAEARLNQIHIQLSGFRAHAEGTDIQPAEGVVAGAIETAGGAIANLTNTVTLDRNQFFWRLDGLERLAAGNLGHDHNKSRSPSAPPSDNPNNA